MALTCALSLIAAGHWLSGYLDTELFGSQADGWFSVAVTAEVVL